MRSPFIAVMMIAAPTFLSGCGADRTLEAPVIRFLHGNPQNGTLVFEVTNPNSSPLFFLGYGSESFGGGLKSGTISPIYGIRLLDDKTWKAHPMGWCGTGMGRPSIVPKGKVTFVCQLPDGSWDEMKVALTWYKSGERKTARTASSDPVKRSEITPKKP